MGVNLEEIKRFFIDFDGVILDSSKVIQKMKDASGILLWEEFFETVDWRKLYYEDAKPINDSINILKCVQEIIGKHHLYILTKINSLNEGIEKVKFLNDHGVYLDVILVPAKIKKSEVVTPDKSDLLIDDYWGNIMEWREDNGEAILFSLKGKKDSIDSLNILKKVKKRTRK